MTVANTPPFETPVAIVAGVTEYTFGFPAIEEAYVQAQVREDDTANVDLVFGVDYTVALETGTDVGGTATLTSAALTAHAGKEIVVYRRTPIVQGTALPNQGPYFSETVEQMHDRAIMIMQEGDYAAQRAFLAPLGSTGGTLAPGVAGSVPVWDANGNIIPGGPTVDEIASAQGFAQSAAAYSPYPDRASLEAAPIPIVVHRVGYINARNQTRWLVRDDQGDAMSNGGNWSPDGVASLSDWNVPTTGAEVLMEKAMNWCIENKRKLVDSGFYTVADAMLLPLIETGGLRFGLTGAYIGVEAGFPANKTKVFSILGGLGTNKTFEWIGGHYNGQNIPAAGTLGGGDFFNISTDDSCDVVKFHPQSCYMGEDYRTSGGDTFAQINADRTDCWIGFAQGTQDLVFYITSSSTAGVARQEVHRIRGHAYKCRYGFSAKRGSGLIDMRVSGTDCISVGSLETAEVGGAVPDIGCDTSYIGVIAKRCERPIRMTRAFRSKVNVVASENGLYLPATTHPITGASLPEYVSDKSSCYFQGATFNNGHISSQGINDDVVSRAYGGGSILDFVALQMTESLNAGDAVGSGVQSTDNNLTVDAHALGRAVLEEQNSNRNQVGYKTSILPANAIVRVGLLSSFNHLGVGMELVSNNTAGPARNILRFRDVDGSVNPAQSLGRIEWVSNDGTAQGAAGYIDARNTDVQGRCEMVIGTGQAGVAVDRMKIRFDGRVEIINPNTSTARGLVMTDVTTQIVYELTIVGGAVVVTAL